MAQQKHKHTSFSDLPYEVLLSITNDLLLSDVVALACASAYHRPFLREQCKLRNIPSKLGNRLFAFRQLESYDRKATRSKEMVRVRIL